jgi:DNA polymerase I-like protein with 3'-5' exonuclease and polymerase domains
MIISVDFETYYDREFSLSKMTTEEYVRDDNFEVIGVGVKVDDAETEWFSGTYSETMHFLGKFKWSEAFVLAHNTMFDGAILSWKFGIKPMAWLDTLCMARATDGLEVGNSLAKLAERYNLGVKGNEVVNAMGKRRTAFSDEDLSRYGSYCRNDVDLTYNLFQRLAPRFNKTELKLIDLTLRMFTEPVLELDLPLLEQHLEEVKEKKEKLMLAADSDKDTLLSNDKFAALLQSIGVTVPTKISLTTGKEAWALAKSDEGLKELQEHEDLRVQALVAARLGTKSTLEETRTTRFIGIAKRGKMPVPLRYYAAHTGRWGGDDKLNLQNLPRSGRLKQAIIPPDGYVIINADSSQIEARTVAWLAGQGDLVDAFDKGEDVYKIMASAIYGKSVEKITKEERFIGKTTILGAGYGMGAVKFQAQLKVFGVDLSEEDCQRIIAVYRQTYPKIPALWKQAQKSLDALVARQTTPIGMYPEVISVTESGIRLPSGLYLTYRGLKAGSDGQYSYKTRMGETKIYGGKVTENFTQAVARCAVGEQMLRVAKKYKVALTVHDSIVCIAKEAEADEAVAYVTECMTWRPKWAQTLPLTCEVGVAKNYGDA